jgi:hypothetical protein
MDKRVFLRGLSALAIGLTAISGVVLTSSPASAATTIVVSNKHDSGAGSLRQAFVDASTGGVHQGVDVAITIPASVSNITLTTGELQYDGGTGGAHALTVTGNGQTVSTSAGGFDVETAGTFTVDNLKVVVSGVGGDGIFAIGPVVADNLSITGADNGISNTSLSAAVTMTNSQITGSQAFGISANGDVTLVRSTIADSAGDGVDSNHGVATLTNSTVTGNATTAGTFAGIWALNVVLRYSTVVTNAANAGDQDVFAQVNLTSSGSVVGLAGAGNACHVGGTTKSLGYNLSDDTSCNFTGTGDRQGASHNPMLAALAANGGATQTRAPSAGSPLIDAIPSAACIAGITTDQRGVTRPQGNACDIGAVEIAAAPVPTTTTTTTTTTPQPVTTPTTIPAATLPRTGGNAGAGSLIALAFLLVGSTFLLAGRAARRSAH